MASPESMVNQVLDCLGVSFNLTVPPLVIVPPIPAFGIGAGIPLLPITVPGVSFSFMWPSISMPGFPALVMGFAGAILAGVNYALGFLPPDPQHLPSLPDIGIFVAGFLAAAPGLPALSPMSISIPGAPPIPFPGCPGVALPHGYDPSAMLNLIGVLIAAPFLLFKDIVQSIINLSLKLPDFATILALMMGLGMSVGLPEATLAFILPCVAKVGKSAISVLG